MTEQYEPFGPYFLTLYCENPDAAEFVDSVYVDGFESEADAWAACNGIALNSIDAIDAHGEPVTIDGRDILQVAITKAIGADFPQSFAA